MEIPGTGTDARIHRARGQFEASVCHEFRALPAEVRAVMGKALGRLRGLARANAAESYRRRKHMQYAYWAVTSVYVGHLLRLLRRVDRTPAPSAEA